MASDYGFVACDDVLSKTASSKVLGYGSWKILPPGRHTYFDVGNSIIGSVVLVVAVVVLDC
jgi:hypothetical protein